MALTAVAIRNTKPSDKPIKLADSGGLYLLLNPNASRWWRWDYRFAGKRKTLSMGTFPDTGIVDARAKRDEARKLLAAGVDPGEHRKARKAASVESAANSFEVVAREWHAKQTQWVEGHASRIMLRLENDVFPWLGRRAITEVTAKDLLHALNRMVDRGAVESAHRVLQNCGQIFRYAIATARAERNPAADLRGALPPVKPTSHAAITDPSQLGGLLRAVDGYEGMLVTKAALRLAPMLFVRPGELRAAEWIEMDLDQALWSIPATRMKSGVAHLVPLPSQAVVILKELHAVTGRGRYVFPGGRSSKRPMSNNCINGALRRLGFDKSTVCGHGFRASARTILDEVLHVRPDFIEHQLAHAVRDPNGRAYNRTAFLPERQAMMQQWADYLDVLRIGGNVVPIRGRSA